MAHKSSKADAPGVDEGAASPPGVRRGGLVGRLLGQTRLSILLMASGLFFAVMLGLAIAGARGFLAMWRLQHEVGQLAQEVRAIEAESRRLRREVQRLHHDPHYIEKIAREELGLVRPGEVVFEFVD